YAIAAALQSLGATVTLVSGPTALPTPLHVVPHVVTSAPGMLEACSADSEASVIIVMSAAVADYTLAAPANQKIKKKEGSLEITVKKTTDILATLGERKTARQTLVGFALETENEMLNAKDKLTRKNLDYLVLNSMQDQGAGFGGDTNLITLIVRSGKVEGLLLKSKPAVAPDMYAITSAS